MRPIKIILPSLAAVITFDAVSAAASLAIGFSYAYAAIGSALLYIICTWFAGRRLSFRVAVFLGMAMGFVDATIGWMVSWVIGPASLPLGTLTLQAWFYTVITVVILGAIYGFAGGGIGALTKQRRAA